MELGHGQSLVEQRMRVFFRTEEGPWGQNGMCFGKGASHPTHFLVPPRVILPHRALFVRIFLLAGKIIHGGMRWLHYLYVCTFGKEVARKDTMWYQKDE